MKSYLDIGNLSVCLEIWAKDAPEECRNNVFSFTVFSADNHRQKIIQPDKFNSAQEDFLIAAITQRILSKGFGVKVEPKNSGFKSTIYKGEEFINAHTSKTAATALLNCYLFLVMHEKAWKS